ncbi:peptidase M55 D-aminopeptidase [Mesotoga sp. Brook.08.YT.4.2.5.1]|mgnify:CR=1 FL=1|uniref:M55 family metallopeptidase n=1 Tax=unclassified Mesotoga TaxID=1184398 RepID=UPI000B07EA88|nr:MULTISPECIES: M55 family metallopeptidase [unclassified Mesotoga]RAM58847.1 D-aminopeptidase [Mesotoga sp. SC_4PWL113PWK15]RAM60734.1 D-aminopeptidase [Mesotoga sp. SC_4PWA21]PNE23148.1 peptidase M55 D-aminopeptidase [Mesotoga sp. Brook.08.YT.4.2.5.1]PNS42289.1 peptidase M55 D-aminopeptidase [Mesotoga sp. B105.6.4]PVD15765.1 amino acid amidase [Mesotoga sp. Brook.08.105.5.1]
MKVYISADIEGTAGIVDWDEAKKGHKDYEYFSKQMTAEVRAAVQGALKAGASEVVVRDAHGSARNIDPSALPSEVRIIRGWARDPLMMMQGINEGFGAAVFTGYHSPSGMGMNPLSHTMSGEIYYLKINGELMSEFLINAMSASYYEVPVVFVSGDEGVSKIAEESVKGIITVPTNRGSGSSVDSIHPEKALKLIEEGVYNAVRKQEAVPLELPAEFNVEIAYIDHRVAHKLSFFPGVSRRDDRTLAFEEKNYYEVLRKLLFLL